MLSAGIVYKTSFWLNGDARPRFLLDRSFASKAMTVIVLNLQLTFLKKLNLGCFSLDYFKTQLRIEIDNCRKLQRKAFLKRAILDPKNTLFLQGYHP